MERHINTIIFRTVIAFLLATAAAQVGIAQEYTNTPVEVSKEKVRIDGKVCYSHIVLERQTLYSISKAYGVSIDDIYRFNPSVKENGLKKNSIIIIPSADALKSESKVSVTQQDTARTVKPEVRPLVKDEKKTAARPEKPAAPKKTVHIVKWYEDLDVIAGQYGVTVEELMAANGLTGRKLKKRQKLVIPAPGEVKVEAIAEVLPEEKKDTVAATVAAKAEEVQAAVEEVTVPVKEYHPVNKVNAAIILPFTNAKGEPSRQNFDFYSGALLAVYDLAEEGIDINLTVHDIMDKNSVYNAEMINSNDVVIGPVSTADLTKLFFTTGGKGNIVSPLDPRAGKLTASYQTLIQAPAPHAAQYQDLVKWMKEDFRTGDKAILITEKGTRQSGIISQMKEALDSSALAYETFSYSILEGRDVTEPLTRMMSTEGANRVLIASESEAFVNDVVRNINLLIYNNLDLVLYAPSKIRSFETIEVENFHNASMHVSLSYYIDYNSAEVKEFLLKYRALYNTEPNQFAFQGYDVTRYFIELCSKYGKDWMEMLEQSDKEMLQSTFRFRKEEGGGYTNSGIQRIVYDNGYSVIKVK